METEQTYFSVFADVDGWSIEDSELILSSDGDEVLRCGGHRSVDG